VVDLVLEHAGKIPVRLDAHGIVVEVHRLDRDMFPTHDLTCPARDAQTSLERRNITVATYDLGIDEDVAVFGIVLVVHARRDVHGDDAPHHPDLRPRETDAIRVEHGLPHVRC